MPFHAVAHTFRQAHMLLCISDIIYIQIVFSTDDNAEVCVGKLIYNSQDVLGRGSHGTVVFK